MKCKTMFMMVLFLTFFSSVTYAFSPMGYPWFTWGELRYADSGAEEDGFKGEGYIEQGIDWFPVLGWTANTFVGIYTVGSSNSDQFWNNKFGIKPGFKFKRSFGLGNSTVLELAAGYRWEYFSFFNGDDTSRGVPFANWYFGGNWNDRNLPWFSWGEISDGGGDPEGSFKVDMFVQQSFDVTTLGLWTTGPYIGFRLIQNDNDDEPWNNKVGPRIGWEFRRPVGDDAFALGIYGDYYNYTGSDVDDELFGAVYMTWWFVGNHKNK